MITCPHCRNTLETTPEMTGDFACPFCGGAFSLGLPPVLVPQATIANPYSAPRTMPSRKKSGVMVWGLWQIVIVPAVFTIAYMTSFMFLDRSYERDAEFNRFVNNEAYREQRNFSGRYFQQDGDLIVKRMLGRMAVTDAMIAVCLGCPIIWGIGYAAIRLKQH